MSNSSGLQSIFRTFNAPDTSDKEPPLPYSTKQYLAARVCRSMEREVGPSTEDTIRKMAALDDQTLVKLALNRGIQFVLNSDGTVHRRPDPWGIVKKDAYSKYDPPEWEGRG